MKYIFILLIQHTLCSGILFAQQKERIINKEDLSFLESLTKAVLDSSRIYPQQSIPEFGANQTGGVLIRPGGRTTYPAFWIRDYAMSLETGFVKKEEQKHMLLLTASTQCDQTWITKEGSMVPLGAIADHIRIDNSLPIYFPGTYDTEAQGVKEFGMFPPYCDQFFFIRMANHYIKTTADREILFKEINGKPLIDRLEIAFGVPPSRKDNHIVYTNEAFRGVDFGFRDVIEITGNLCYASILKYIAANDLYDIFASIENKDKADYYKHIARSIKTALPAIFLNKDGMLLASTGKSNQPDVWATSLAIYLDILNGEDALNACRHLADAYGSGSLAYKGNIRHIITTEDHNAETAWQKSLVPKNQYQNGAYWGTPTGWVASAIAKVNSAYAQQLIKEYITHLRETDYRKGASFGGPFECITASGTQGPVYLTTVACPYIVLKAMERGE
ncbi:hypothetical protein [Agriterribacter sp.]|uniref:hypothetical protein n=1 Tax=Agriterribacter sp. TaxID=2821509 RepID=UPI002BCB179A|nr:hypothetical protein [Agriterribacter sp.]HRP57542.1 hypothetical protein [Agriterribacter sp.]